MVTLSVVCKCYFLVLFQRIFPCLISCEILSIVAIQIWNSAESFLISILSLVNLVQIRGLSWNVNLWQFLFLHLNVYIGSDNVSNSSIGYLILSLLFSLNCCKSVLNWSWDFEMPSVDMWLHSGSKSSCCSNNYMSIMISAFHSFLRSNK